MAFEETLAEEADAAALWLKSRLAVRGPHGKLPTAAMLFRARKTQGVFIEALRTHGVPFHVLGVGGLMAEPEIADLVCALTVIHDPNAGSELVRLLSGSRWRIGVRDLRALSRLASTLRGRDYAQRALDDQVKQRMRESVADSEGASIVDALDFLAHAAPSHSFLADFSEVGLTRLRQAGLTLARLRARSTLDLLDFITLVEQDFLLDVEIAANEFRPLGSANLDAFFDAVNGYLAVNEIAGLGGFLSWLREAEWRDGLSPRPEDAEPGTVQLLTIHGSKGLEWDIVAVPRQVEQEMPATGREGSNGWLGFGTLPYEFRGDAPELPEFRWRQAGSRKELLELRTEFKTGGQGAPRVGGASTGLCRGDAGAALASAQRIVLGDSDDGPRPEPLPHPAGGSRHPGRTAHPQRVQREPARRLGGGDRVAAGSARGTPQRHRAGRRTGAGRPARRRPRRRMRGPGRGNSTCC